MLVPNEMTILYSKKLLSLPVHYSLGLQSELCLINHAASHGPMNQAAISSVSACICSTALPYPQAAAFTPFFCPLTSAHSWLFSITALHPLHAQMESVLWNCNEGIHKAPRASLYLHRVNCVHLQYCVCLWSSPNACPCGLTNLHLW